MTGRAGRTDRQPRAPSSLLEHALTTHEATAQPKCQPPTSHASARPHYLCDQASSNKHASAGSLDGRILDGRILLGRIPPQQDPPRQDPSTAGSLLGRISHIPFAPCDGGTMGVLPQPSTAAGSHPCAERLRPRVVPSGTMALLNCRRSTGGSSRCIASNPFPGPQPFGSLEPAPPCPHMRCSSHAQLAVGVELLCCP
jgi:hypothetical protein